MGLHPVQRRMLSELRLIQEAMPGMLAADSMAYVLGHLIAQGGVPEHHWSRAIRALGEEHPTRREAMDKALAARSQEPGGRLLRVVEDPPENRS